MLINLQHISILNWYKKLILPFFSGQINCLVVFKFPLVYTEVVIVFFGVGHTPTILPPHVSPCHICFPIQNSSSILLSIFIAYLNRDPQRDSTLTTHGFLSWVAFFFHCSSAIFILFRGFCHALYLNFMFYFTVLHLYELLLIVN